MSGGNTLRAAFDGLVRRGLLVKSRNRGVFVRALTAHDLAEIYELRTALEVQAARMLATAELVPEAARTALDPAQSPRSPFVAAGGGRGRPRLSPCAGGWHRQCASHPCAQESGDRDPALSRATGAGLCIGRPARGRARRVARSNRSRRPRRLPKTVIRHHLENATTWLVEHAARPAGRRLRGRPRRRRARRATSGRPRRSAGWRG